MIEPARRKARPSTAAKDADGGGDEKAADRRRLGVRLLGLLTAEVLVLAIGCVTLWTERSRVEATDRARADALTAAQSYVKDLLSYDYRNMEHDLKAATAHMTPRMVRAYEDYYRRTLIPAVRKTKAQALTQPQTGGVMRASPDRVDVVLFVKMVSVNSVQKEPTVGAQRLRLEMRRSGTRWLIDGPLLKAQNSGGPPVPGSSPTPPGSSSKRP